MFTGTKTISLLLVALIATWLPMGPCCLAMACSTGPDQAPAPQKLDQGCGSCDESDAPSPPAQTPDPASPCRCADRLAASPDHVPLTLASASAPLSPALDLPAPLVYGIEPAAVRRPRPRECDAGPPLSSQTSLLAQACLLIV